jgi:hypothetical protein
MTETAVQIFGKIHENNIFEITSYLDIDTLFNLLEVVESDKYLRNTLMLVVNNKMKEVRAKSRLLLWTPNHFTRRLNVLSDINLAHVALLKSLFGEDNRERVLKFMKYNFTEEEQPALVYIRQFYDNSSPLFEKSNLLYDELLQECLFRQFNNYM